MPPAPAVVLKEEEEEGDEEDKTGGAVSLLRGDRGARARGATTVAARRKRGFRGGVVRAGLHARARGAQEPARPHRRLSLAAESREGGTVRGPVRARDVPPPRPHRQAAEQDAGGQDAQARGLQGPRPVAARAGGGVLRSRERRRCPQRFEGSHSPVRARRRDRPRALQDLPRQVVHRRRRLAAGPRPRRQAPRPRPHRRPPLQRLQPARLPLQGDRLCRGESHPRQRVHRGGNGRVLQRRRRHLRAPRHGPHRHQARRRRHGRRLRRLHGRPPRPRRRR
mmetsp:Transcript_4275/g.13329  ORF Transcript_4275/g.13329 Transcript_4275/m.13329 type:complete len:280 (+) Transcript_4275:227-1066(+)